MKCLLKRQQQQQLYDDDKLKITLHTSLTTFCQKLKTRLFRQSYQTLFYNCVAIVVLEDTFT